MDANIVNALRCAGCPGQPSAMAIVSHCRDLWLRRLDLVSLWWPCPLLVVASDHRVHVCPGPASLADGPDRLSHPTGHHRFPPLREAWRRPVGRCDAGTDMP